VEPKIVQFDTVYSPEIINVRTKVFVREQGIDLELDFDGLDEDALHILVFANSKSVGTGRMLDDGHIGRIAVLKDFRGQGIGAMIVKALIKEAKNKNYKRLYLGSQLYATAFYEKLGFKTCGEVFMDAGLEHIEMEMLLT